MAPSLGVAAAPQGHHAGSEDALFGLRRRLPHCAAHVQAYENERINDIGAGEDASLLLATHVRHQLHVRGASHNADRSASVTAAAPGPQLASFAPFNTKGTCFDLQATALASGLPNHFRVGCQMSMQKISTRCRPPQS